METLLSADNLSVNLRYLGILLCLILSLLVAWKTPNKRDAYHQAACLLFAVIADYFLLYTEYFLAGIMIFWCAHLCAIRRYRKKLFLPVVIMTAIAGIICCILNLAAKNINATALLVASAIYAILISTATISTFFYKQAPINNVCSRLGMCLFILCDINVVLFNTLPHDVLQYGIASKLMWVFYLPAQILLSVSAYDFKRLEKFVK